MEKKSKLSRGAEGSNKEQKVEEGPGADEEVERGGGSAVARRLPLKGSETAASGVAAERGGGSIKLKTPSSEAALAREGRYAIKMRWARMIALKKRRHRKR